MSPEEVERKKVENERKHGGNGEADDAEPDAAAPDVDESAADAFEEADDSGAKEDGEGNQGGDDEENKDTPHYKLQVFLALVELSFKSLDSRNFLFVLIFHLKFGKNSYISFKTSITLLF